MSERGLVVKRSHMGSNPTEMALNHGRDRRANENATAPKTRGELDRTPWIPDPDRNHGSLAVHGVEAHCLESLEHDLRIAPQSVPAFRLRLEDVECGQAGRCSGRGKGRRENQ